MRRLMITALLAAALLPTSALALTATQSVLKEVTTTSPDGVVSTKLIPAEGVTPGENVVYRIDFTNTKDEAATDLQLAMPVPQNVAFIEGSADREGAIVRYSMDGGQTYDSREALLRPAVGGGTRPVRSDEITHVRWTIAGPINVGQSDAVSFKARLR